MSETQTQNHREKVLIKIQKLKAMAESAQQTSTEAEAQAFAARVQELLTRYKIEEAELRSISDEDPLEPIVQVWVPHSGFTKYAGKKSTAEGFPRKRQRVAWSETLASVVGRVNYCRIMVTEKANSICFVGRKLEADASVQTFVYLAAVAERIAWVEYQKFFDASAAQGRPELARGFRSSFLLGFVSRLNKRYDEHMTEMRNTWLKDTQALTVLKDALTQVDEHLAQMSTKKASALGHRVKNGAGWRRGQEVANEINLTGKQIGA